MSGKGIEIERPDWRFCQVAKEMVFDTDLSDGAKATFMVLLFWSQGDAGVWPSVATLAKARGSGERTVARHLSDLEGAGWLKRTPREGTSTLYTLRHYWQDTPANSGRGGKPKTALDIRKKKKEKRASPQTSDGKRFARQTLKDGNEHMRLQGILNRHMKASGHDEDVADCVKAINAHVKVLKIPVARYLDWIDEWAVRMRQGDYVSKIQNKLLRGPLDDPDVGVRNDTPRDLSMQERADRDAHRVYGGGA